MPLEERELWVAVFLEETCSDKQRSTIAGKRILRRKLTDTQRSDRWSAIWGARYGKAVRRDLLGACLVRGTSTNQIARTTLDESWKKAEQPPPLSVKNFMHLLRKQIQNENCQGRMDQGQIQSSTFHGSKSAGVESSDGRFFVNYIRLKETIREKTGYTCLSGMDKRICDSTITLLYRDLSGYGRNSGQRKYGKYGIMQQQEVIYDSDTYSFYLSRQGVEHMFWIRLVGQNAANRGNRKKFYYGFTTTQQSNHNMLYKWKHGYTRYSISFKCWRYLRKKMYMSARRANEHQLLKCGTSGQIAADWERNTFYYYGSTTVQKS